VGLTDESITLGGVFQLSGPVTGFAQQFLTGVRAKLAQVNGTGGVCGRKVEYLSRDDGFDAARHAAQTRDLMPKVLAIAGSFSTVDNGGASALQGSNVPDVSIAATPERGALPNNISHSIFPKRPGKATNTYRWFAENGATKVALVYVSLASARNLMDIQQESFEASGIKVVKRIELAPTQFSYDATARDVANSGADMMFFLHEINAAAAMAQALDKTPSSLKFPMYSAFSYGDRYLQLAGSAAEGSVTILPFTPFEEAASNPPTQELMRWIQAVAPGEPPTFDAANGWTATGLIIEALGRLPGPITRAALMTALKGVQDYDGNGVWSLTHPATRSGGGSVIMRVKDGKWVREAPAKGFIAA
jgi:ABC-type branched-subunit amino acid transport system substrate-binding protein